VRQFSVLKFSPNVFPATQNFSASLRLVLEVELSKHLAYDLLHLIAANIVFVRLLDDLDGASRDCRKLVNQHCV